MTHQYDPIASTYNIVGASFNDAVDQASGSWESRITNQGDCSYEVWVPTPLTLVDVCSFCSEPVTMTALSWTHVNRTDCTGCANPYRVINDSTGLQLGSFDTWEEAARYCSEIMAVLPDRLAILTPAY